MEEKSEAFLRPCDELCMAVSQADISSVPVARHLQASAHAASKQMLKLPRGEAHLSEASFESSWSQHERKHCYS